MCKFIRVYESKMGIICTHHIQYFMISNIYTILRDVLEFSIE